MPDRRSLFDEIVATGTAHDAVRRKYVQNLFRKTGRNVIIYYSGWLQRKAEIQQGITGFELDDADKNGFMAAIRGMDASLGLDLVLHTPGGDVAATESLVDYLRDKFGTNIRAIVPQIAMSAGTMIACACKKIVMGRHSNLGPIDPLIMNGPAHAYIEEFERAKAEIRADPSSAPLWIQIIGKYPPTLIVECERAIKWSRAIVREWLRTGMFDGHPDAAILADAVVNELGDPQTTMFHGRHISIHAARKVGLQVDSLEDDDDFQDAVLSVHHTTTQTLSDYPILKIIENQHGVGIIQGFQQT